MPSLGTVKTYRGQAYKLVDVWHLEQAGGGLRTLREWEGYCPRCEAPRVFPEWEGKPFVPVCSGASR